MAKSQINTKSKDYSRDKEAFMRELKQFCESKNLPFKPPNINGVDIDLYLFYSLVQQKGGLSKVNQIDAWESFLRPLKLPHPCINGSTLLKKIYATHLEKFDRAKCPAGRDDEDLLEEDFRTRTRRTRDQDYSRVGFSGAYISASGEQLRTGARPIAGPSERLALSLLSPMPNEQDFAVNVCTVLAADYSNRLPLSTLPHMLDFLLAHAGVYNHPSLRETIGRSYYEARGMYPDDFWKKRAGGGGARELADETKFCSPGLEQPELFVQAMAAQNTLTDALMKDGLEEVIEKIIDEDIIDDWMTEPCDEDQLFAPELPGGAKCVFTQRVLQVASIVRSLSFHEENLQHLARNVTLIRFLLLCANCWVGSLRQAGLDTLGNVCAELVVKDPATCLLSRHILSTIQASLSSPDRARVLAALEMLNKLAQNEANEDALLKALEGKVYCDVCALLTLRDIMVLVCALECIYAVTSLGERASEHVARAPGALRTLLALVTVEAQSYGPRACILMRVVETVSGATADPAPAQDKPQAHQATPQMVTLSAPAKAPPAPPAAAATPAPVNNVQMQHLQQKTVQENEQFALAWLRASYEPLPPGDNSGVSPADVHRQYAACCAKLNRKGCVPPHHLPRLVRTVFGGTVGPSTVTISTGETQQLYVGVRARSQAVRLNQPAGPSSPILKAQLTTSKAGVIEAKPVISQTQAPQQAAAHPQLAGALEAPSSTSLIKHLLAHKVSPSPATTTTTTTTTLQVAQRQQNQQRIAPNHIQQNSNLDDPEALIKCTTILPGVATTGEKVIVTTEEPIIPKEEPVQIQIDEQSQITIKSAQNKMLADLLEKKSSPPVQVVQMSHHAPTIQITESGHIVQVKPDGPVLVDAGGSAPFYQLKNEQSQIFQLKNEQGQIIHFKNEQGQLVQIKSDQLSHMILKNEQGNIIHGSQLLQQTVNQNVNQSVSQVKIEVDSLKNDHSYTEPPLKKPKLEEKREKSPQESVSKTAANLYAALAASALEDEEDLAPPKQEGGENGVPVLIQEPILQVQQPTLQVQQPTMQVQTPTIQVSGVGQVGQGGQPMLQVAPMDVQNIITSQGPQLILQEKPMQSQTQYVQQPMQIIATPGTSQGGISYLTPNMQNMQKTIIIVQGATGGGPITLTVNNPGGLDEATLNSVIAQATEAITQQQLMQSSGVIQSTQRVIVSQSQNIVVKNAIAQSAPQLSTSQQPIITTQPQPHKAQIVNQQQIVVTQKQPPALINSSNVNGNQQILVSNNQQILVNTPMKTVHRVGGKGTVIQSTGSVPVVQQKLAAQPIIRQVISRQPVVVGGTKIGEKEVVVNQTVNQSEPPMLVPTKSKTPTPKPASTPPPVQSPQEDTPWICHWRGCGKTFANAPAVFTHCARAHCPGGAGGEAACLWADCDRVPRKTFALLNHLNDRHCTAEALKTLYNTRKQSPPEAEPPPPAVSYPPNAALSALNKHAVDFMNPKELMQRAAAGAAEPTDENEGPVTKSIRLTAALILRNLVIYSNTGRRQLRTYESQLANIAFSNVEASRTIAQVLYDMNNI